ncbi:DUF7551 domain-containing protein [Halomarina ordinaria]
MGNTLRTIRRRIDAHSTPTGRFFVRCARTGERPVPVATARFLDRETAVAAARLASAYRSELRRYDPGVRWHDLVVCESVGRTADATAPARADRTRNDPLVEFCHEVAATVFEALSAGPHRRVERAAMDAYLEHAESVTDPDDLCLTLLVAIARALDEHLAPGEQAAVLRAAADRLDGSDAPQTTRPLTAAFDDLRRVALIDDYEVEPGRAVDGRRWTVRVDGYALAAEEDGLPTLPIVVDLLRTLPRDDVTVTEASRIGGDWSLTLVVGGSRCRPRALARVRTGEH